MNIGNLCSRAIKYSLYLLIFLLPLFFLPFSFEAFEFNKQYLLFFLVSIAFLAWIAKMVLVDKEIRFRRTPLDVPILIFLGVAILSAIFSVDKSSSLFGFYGRFSDGLIGLLSLGIFYFLITNNVSIRETDAKQDAKQTRNKISGDSLMKLFLGSAFFVILFSYFSIFGLWEKIQGLPEVMQQATFNTVSGSLEGLAVFLSVIIVLLVGLLLQSQISKFKPFPYWILLLASLFLLLIITQSSIFNLQLPKEQILDQGTSWGISLGAITDNVKNGFLGSGIGTFFYDFSKQKPAEFNQSQFWQIRFDRPGSHIAEILSTMGVLGILSYLFLIGMFLLISWIFLISRQFSGIPLLMVFLALLVAQFVYYQNTVLAFTFWLVLALSANSWPSPIKEKTFSLKKSPELRLISTVCLIIIGLGILMSYYFVQKFYRADMAYAKGQFEKAVSLNPNLSQYRIILARDYLGEVLQEMRKPLAEQNSILLQNKVAKAIDTAKTSTLLSPNNVAGWETLGIVYRDIHLVVEGAGEWGIKAFEKAITLESTNPVLHTELGKLYLVSDEIQKAKEEFKKTKELKPDYLPALLQEALIYEREDNLLEAVKKMEALARDYPFNTDVLFQLGRLYFNDNQIDEAIFQFEQVVEIFPNHSNAHYSLGVCWSSKGETEKAIKEFERVLELNPGNVEVIQKLEELKK